MVEYSKFSDYVSHNKTFNVVFTTIVSILINLFIGILLNSLGIMSSDWGLFTAVFLVTVPAIVYITESTKYEGAIAYHYIWKDVRRGLKDRKLIITDYGKQHGINNLKEYLETNRPDGRWNYHVYTKYMEQLAISRNAILIGIKEECAEKISELKKDFDCANERMGEVAPKISVCYGELDAIERKLIRAITGAQKYHLEKEKQDKQNELHELISQKVELKCQMNSLEDEIRKHEIAFVGQKSKIEQDYKIRSDNYARIATKELEKNGLKYVIESLMTPDYWINNPQERSKIYG